MEILASYTMKMVQFHEDKEQEVWSVSLKGEEVFVGSHRQCMAFMRFGTNV